MNPNQEKIIAEMGIGPVWKLRSNLFQQTSAAQVLPSLNLSAEPNSQFGTSVQVDPDTGLNSRASNPICQTCGWCVGNSSDVHFEQASGTNYFFIYENPVDNESALPRGLPVLAEQLLNRILRELRVDIGVNACVGSIVKTKHPNSSGLSSTQKGMVTACLLCLQKQIKLVRPTVIISLGSGATMAMLGFEASDALSAMRGQVYRYDEIPLIVTHELNYLLQHPKEKYGLWSDLCLAMSAI